MHFFNISPSGAKILAAVYESGTISIPALSSAVLLTPREIRVDVEDLQAKGFANIATDNYVYITPRGREVACSINKHPEIIVSEAEAVPHDIDPDTALDEVLGKVEVV